MFGVIFLVIITVAAIWWFYTISYLNKDNNRTEKLDRFCQQSHMDKAKPLYSNAENKSETQALGKFGAMFLNGLSDVIKNKAQDEQIPPFLALMHERGMCEIQNLTQAQVWHMGPVMREGAQKHNVLDSTIHYQGDGVSEDFAKAKAWYEKAVADMQTEIPFREKYAYKEQNKDAPSVDDLHAVEEQPEYAIGTIEWYEKAASQGDVQAQTHLGILYAQGESVPQDLVKAKKLFEMAANQGDVTAHVHLAKMYESGQGAIQSYVRAAVLYRKAADQGNAVAQMALSHLYAEGLGVFQDNDRAKYYHDLASKSLSR